MQPLAEPLLVGATVSLSGRFSREGAALRAGYQSWARAANEAGGVAVDGQRRSVRLLVYDDASDPLTAVRMVEQLAREDGVGLLLGPHSGPLTAATATAAERLGALTVAPDAASPALYERGLRMLVSVLPTEDRYFDGLLDLADRLSPRPRSMALFVPDDPFFGGAVEGARDRARGLGLRPPLVERYALDAREVLEALDRIAESRPEVLLIGGEPERLALFVPQLRQLRLAPPLRAVATPHRSGDLPAALSDDLEGVVALDWWWPELAFAGPLLGSARDFAATFEQHHGYRPDARAASAAAAGLALQLGVERAGSAEPGPVRTALGELDVQTFWGRLAWDAQGRNRAASVPLVQFQQGRPLVIHPSGAAGAQLRYPLADWPSALRRPAPPPVSSRSN